MRERHRTVDRVNDELARAKAEEAANVPRPALPRRRRPRDILQPLEHRRLYAAAMRARQSGAPAEEVVGLALNVDSPAGGRGGPLRALLEMSRLDAGATKVEPAKILLVDELFRQFEDRIAPLGEKKGAGADLRRPVRWRCAPACRLLRRLLQNLYPTR